MKFITGKTEDSLACIYIPLVWDLQKSQVTDIVYLMHLFHSLIIPQFYRIKRKFKVLKDLFFLFNVLEGRQFSKQLKVKLGGFDQKKKWVEKKK